MYIMLQSPNKWLNQISDRVRHFSNRCDIFKVAKAVHGKQSDSHPNWSDAKLSILVLELYKQPPCSFPLLECARAHTHTHTRARTGATHTHAQVQHTQAHRCNTHTHMRTGATHTHTHTYSHTHASHTHTHMPHTHTHTQTCKCMRSLNCAAFLRTGQTK